MIVPLASGDPLTVRPALARQPDPRVPEAAGPAARRPSSPRGRGCRAGRAPRVSRDGLAPGGAHADGPEESQVGDALRRDARTAGSARALTRRRPLRRVAPRPPRSAPASAARTTGAGVAARPVHEERAAGDVDHAAARSRAAASRRRCSVRRQRRPQEEPAARLRPRHQAAQLAARSACSITSRLCW